MSKKKKSGFDPFKAVVSHGALTAGTIGSIGTAGHINQTMPSATGHRVMAGMDTLKVVQTVHFHALKQQQYLHQLQAV